MGRGNDPKIKCELFGWRLQLKRQAIRSVVNVLVLPDVGYGNVLTLAFCAYGFWRQQLLRIKLPAAVQVDVF